ncbi:hypothetical protein SSPS47_08270 [Streptomyces sp. S4.7]|nr:hypothetical protein SSPS47_08270 [Streptomyces sp. S4.7]
MDSSRYLVGTRATTEQNYPIVGLFSQPVRAYGAYMRNHTVPRERSVRESDTSLAELRGDCARMAPHWVRPATAAPVPVPPSLIHGVTVPSASARLIDGMSEYGD